MEEQNKLPNGVRWLLYDDGGFMRFAAFLMEGLELPELVPTPTIRGNAKVAIASVRRLLCMNWPPRGSQGRPHPHCTQRMLKVPAWKPSYTNLAGSLLRAAPMAYKSGQ